MKQDETSFTEKRVMQDVIGLSLHVEMNNYMKIFFSIIIISLLVLGCSNSKSEIDKIEHIKKVGNMNPTLAIEMLDSVSTEMLSKSTYVNMKYDLLKIRLYDKTFIPAKSDNKIKKVVEYFTKHGTNLEIQEALYYAGSVYRDLNDTPRALDYFLQSKLRCKNGVAYDTVILRNTLSNLSYVYYNVQDYSNALKYAKEDYELSKEINDLDATTVLGVATSLIRLGKEKEAKQKLSETLHLLHNSRIEYYSQEIFSLLYHFSVLKMKSEAEYCYADIKDKGISCDYADAMIAMGEYFIFKEKIVPAIEYYKGILNLPESYQGKYDACKELVNLYNRLGDKKLASFYADKFVKICDTLNLGERQRQAATVNNKFKYYQDEKRERELVERGKLYRLATCGVAVVSAIVLLLLLVFILYKRNARLKLLLEKDLILKKANQDIIELESDIADKDREVNNLLNSLELTNKKMEDMNRKIKETEAELFQNEQLLSEKIKQNNSFIKLLHQTELEEKASDVIEATRNSANGKYKMSSDNWKKLFRAVDELHPNFSGMLAEKLGRISEQELQFCYLLRIGLSNTQINNITELSRSTVWRWANKYQWIAVEASKYKTK